MWMRVFLFLALTSLIVHGAATKRSPTKIQNQNKPKEPESASDEEVEFDGEWECGGEDLSKLISYQMIAKDCPSLLHTVNNCCLGHDKCYDDQLGQAHCDKIFCGCLDKATYSPKNENKICHEEHAPYFCNMVQEFGESFYSASANKTNHFGSGEEPREVQLTQTSLNQTDSGEHARIYESRTYESAHAIKNLPHLEALN